MSKSLLNRPKTTEEHKQRLMDIQSARRPFISALSGIYNTQLPKITIFQDGRVKREYPIETQATIDKIKWHMNVATLRV